MVRLSSKSVALVVSKTISCARSGSADQCFGRGPAYSTTMIIGGTVEATKFTRCYSVHTASYTASSVVRKPCSVKLRLATWTRRQCVEHATYGIAFVCRNSAWSLQSRPVVHCAPSQVNQMYSDGTDSPRTQLCFVKAYSLSAWLGFDTHSRSAVLLLQVVLFRKFYGEW